MGCLCWREGPSSAKAAFEASDIDDSPRPGRDLQDTAPQRTLAPSVRLKRRSAWDNLYVIQNLTGVSIVSVFLAIIRTLLRLNNC